MDQDYDYIRNILTILKTNSAHEMSKDDLANQMGLDLNHEEFRDKFIGHIKLLNDQFLIDADNPNFGFRRLNHGYVEAPCNYRLTSEGYKFLEALQNEKVFNKIKQYSIGFAKDIAGEYLKKIILGNDS